MSCNIFNSCCWGMLVYFLCILHNNMHSAKIVHEFTASSSVKNDLYSMTKMVSVKVKWMQTITSFSVWKSTINEWIFKPHLFHANMQYISNSISKELVAKCIISCIFIPIKVICIAYRLRFKIWVQICKMIKKSCNISVLNMHYLWVRSVSYVCILYNAYMHAIHYRIQHMYFLVKII